MFQNTNTSFTIIHDKDRQQILTFKATSSKNGYVVQHSCPKIKFPGFCINTVWCKVTWANELIEATVTIATSKANCPSGHSVNHQELKQSSRGMSRGEPENIFSIKYSWYCVAWCHKASHTSPGGSSPPTWVTWCKHKQSGHRGEQTETTFSLFSVSGS